VESDDLTCASFREGPNGQLRNAHGVLTKTGRGLIAASMINAATIVIVRRRRTSAVWADVCV
jgi:hypothetical protein